MSGTQPLVSLEFLGKITAVETKQKTCFPPVFMVNVFVILNNSPQIQWLSTSPPTISPSPLFCRCPAVCPALCVWQSSGFYPARCIPVVLRFRPMKVRLHTYAPCRKDTWRSSTLCSGSGMDLSGTILGALDLSWLRLRVIWSRPASAEARSKHLTSRLETGYRSKLLKKISTQFSHRFIGIQLFFSPPKTRFYCFSVLFFLQTALQGSLFFPLVSLYLSVSPPITSQLIRPTGRALAHSLHEKLFLLL